MKIETERLIIDNFRLSDLNNLKKIIFSYEASPYAIYDHKWPVGDEDIKGIIEWFSQRDDFLAVRLREKDFMIGFVSLVATENSGEYNIGYCFDFEYHSKGYATESCRALFKYAFSNLNALKIVTGTAIENEASCNLLKKLGMKKINESLCSFREDVDGNPIEFIAGNYEIDRANWI